MTFTVTASVAGATQMAVNGGDRQTGTVGQALPTPLSVRVADQFNNPVAGVTISWAVISGAGSPNPATSTSNTSGIASTTWTLGTRRTATDSVQSAQATGVGSPVSFTAFSIAGPVNAAQTTLVASPATITASSGTSASTITVTARDQYGNPVRGKTVTLTATGSANALVQPRDTTDPNGVATGSLSSTFAEAKVLSATVPGISITQRDTVTVSPAAATQLAFLVGPSNVAAGAAITPPIQVEVRDQFNNRVTAASPGVSLGFGNNAGGGTLSGGGQQMAANGVATFGAASIDKAGTGYTLVASSAPLAQATSGSFDVTAAAATKLALTTPPSSTARSGAPLAQQPVVQLQDANGNPVSRSGVVVTATPSPAGATASNNTATTGLNGSATFSSLTLTGTAGSYTLSFGGGTGISPAMSGAIALSAGTAASIAANSPVTQDAPAGSAVHSPPAVIIRDASGNPVAGVAVTFAAAPGSGSVTPTTPVATGADGVAAATSWTLSPTAGTNTLTATSGTLSGSPVTFTATGTAGTATQLVLTTPPSSTARSGVPLAQQPVVQLQDANGNPVSRSGVVVTATPSPAGATASNNTATTGPTGAATFNNLTLTGTAGSYTLSFGATGITPASSGPIALSAGAAASIAANGGGTSAPAGTAVAPPPSVIVKDASGNPVAGVVVNFAAG